MTSVILSKLKQNRNTTCNYEKQIKGYLNIKIIYTYDIDGFRCYLIFTEVRTNSFVEKKVRGKQKHSYLF